MIREIKSQRPLITAWVQAGSLLGLDHDQLRVGFPPDQKMFVESLNKPNNRKLLETVLAKLAGRSLGLKLELLDPRDDDSPDAGDQPPPPTQPNGNGPKGHGTSAPAVARQNGADAPQQDPAESFKNDPLIQKALKIFEGEIRSVNGPA